MADSGFFMWTFEIHLFAVAINIDSIWPVISNKLADILVKILRVKITIGAKISVLSKLNPGLPLLLGKMLRYVEGVIVCVA